MSFATVQGVLSAALAPAGTLALSYPPGWSRGDFLAGYAHKVVFGGNNELTAPTDFTLSFGTTSITYTHGSGASTVPAGTRFTVQMDSTGMDDKDAINASPPPRVANLRPVRVSIGSPITADADGISASQSVSAGASALLNGALLSTIVSGRMIFDVPRNVVGAWTTTSVITITGKDEYGNTMVETSASGTSHTGKKAFKEITSISSSASITSATFGTGVIFGLPIFLQSKNRVLAEYQSDVMLPVIGGNIVCLSGQALEAAVDAGTGLNLVCPVAGVIRKMSTIAQTGITTGGAVTLTVNTVAVNGLSVVIADSAAEGDVDSDTPTYGHASTVVAVGDRLEVTFDAAINASSDLVIVIEIEATKDTHGTVVVGNSSAAQSGTSNDVRGTYSPAATPDGSIGFALDLLVGDPSYKGEAQYAG